MTTDTSDEKHAEYRSIAVEDFITIVITLGLLPMLDWCRSVLVPSLSMHSLVLCCCCVDVDDG